MINITVFIDHIYVGLKHYCVHLEHRLSKCGYGLKSMENRRTQHIPAIIIEVMRNYSLWK